MITVPIIGLLSGILYGICLVLIFVFIWCFQKFQKNYFEKTELFHDIEEADENVNTLIDFKIVHDITLHVKSLNRSIPTPKKIYPKHVIKGYVNVNRQNALKLSEQRGIKFAKKCRRNTVFEDPIQFYLCYVDDLSKLDSKSNFVYVPHTPVQTFQCFNDKTSLKWFKVNSLGLKYPIFEKHWVKYSYEFHFLRKCLKYNNVEFV